MSKFIVIYIFSLLFSFSSKAQQFNFTHLPGNKLMDKGSWGESILPIDNDTILVAIEYLKIDNIHNRWATRLQKLVNNNIVFEKETSDSFKNLGYALSKIIKINDTSYLNIINYRWYTGINVDTPHNGAKLIWVNPKNNFNTILSKDFPPDSITSTLNYTNGVLFNDFIYLTGIIGNVFATNTMNILVSKFTVSGINIWNKTYGVTNKNDIGYQIATVGNDKILISARTGETSNSSGDVIDYQNSIHLIDTSGSLVFEKNMWKNTNSYITNIHNSNDGYFYYGNAQDTMLEADDYPDFNGTIAKIDSVGTIIWQKYFNEIPNTSKNIYNFESLPNSDVIITGSIGFDREGWACLMDKNGVVKWQQSYKSFAGSTFNILACSMQAANGDFVFAGTAIDSAMLKQGTWLLRVDSNGCLIPGNCAPLAVVQTELDFAFDINIFPNPATTTININSAISGFINGSIVLYDINGKVVFQQAFHHQKTIQINSSNLPQGMYVLRYYDIDRDVWLNKKVLIN
jgi:hypothetical protein